jgi:hypothetical protein
MIICDRDAKLRMPDFLVVGAARSGTTTVTSRLARHPRLFLPSKKEPMFFSVYGQDWSYIDIRTGREATYVVGELDDYLHLFQPAGHDQLVGEASTWYLYLYQTTIGNIRKIYGEKSAALRIIILLRNPVERAWSHYWLKRRNGDERLVFEEAIDPGVVKQRQENRFVLGFDYIGFGKYYLQVKAYQEAFDRVKVLLFDDLMKNFYEEMGRIFEFLELRPVDISLKANRLNVAGRPKNEFYGLLQKFIYQPNALKSLLKNLVPHRLRTSWKNNLSEVLLRHEPMSEELRKKLTEAYRQDVHDLGRLIGRDLSHWLSER